MTDLPVVADYGSALAVSFGLNAVFGGWRGVYKFIVKRQRALSKEARRLDSILSAEIELEQIAMSQLIKTIDRGKWWRRKLWQTGRGIGFLAASLIYVALFHFPQEPVTAAVQYTGLAVAYASPFVMLVMMLVGWGFNSSATTQRQPLQQRADEVEQANKEAYSVARTRLAQILSSKNVPRGS